jgi:hypothetical protein
MDHENYRPVQGFSAILRSVFLDSRRYGPTIARLFSAGIAQLVERNLAKVEVASSSLVSRSRISVWPQFPADDYEHERDCMQPIGTTDLAFARDAFISYANQDTAVAAALCASLEQRPSLPKRFMLGLAARRSCLTHSVTRVRSAAPHPASPSAPQRPRQPLHRHAAAGR